MAKLIPVLLNYLWCWIYWSSVLSQYSMAVKGKSTQTRWPGFESWPYQVILLFCASVSWSVVLRNWCPLLLKNLILSIFIFISFWDCYYWMPAHLLLASISFSFSFAFPISLSFTAVFWESVSVWSPNSRSYSSAVPLLLFILYIIYFNDYFYPKYFILTLLR